jgi:HEAT repeat protein
MLTLKIALGKVDNADIEKLEAKRKVKRLCKLLNYKTNKTSVWDVPSPNGGRSTEAFMAIPAEHTEWVLNYGVRSRAAEALGNIGDSHSISALVRSLTTDPSEHVKIRAARALHKLDWQPKNSEVAATYWCCMGNWDKCKDNGRPAVDALLAMLAYDETKRREISKTLSEIGETAVDQIIGNIERWKQQYFSWIKTALTTGLDFRSAEAYLIASCIEGTRDVLTACIATLGHIGDPRSKEYLTSLNDILGKAISDKSTTALRRTFFCFDDLQKSIDEALTACSE